MPLPTPNLDDRKFQDILDEARRLIPRYCPEWTDHNLSDPGITVLELFSWMTDMLIYRLNRVPEKNYVKFLDLIGIKLEPAHPARTTLSFRLAAPIEQELLIPIGTPVGTVRTETKDSIIFTTDEDLVLQVPEVNHLLVARGGSRFHDYQAALRMSQRGLGIFSEIPREEDAFYIGVGTDLKAHTMLLSLDCTSEGVGVDPASPPLAWEVWDQVDEQWSRMTPELDTTGGLNRDGVILLQVPRSAGMATVERRRAFWIRCRVLRPRPGQSTYAASPRIVGVKVNTLGGVIPASHTFDVIGEVLGTSEGQPGESFRIARTPVMPRRHGETVYVEAGDGTAEAWVEVENFGASGPTDPHFTIDEVSGTVEFGPLIRAPHGEERQHGRLLPTGATVRMARYRSGGGLIGNVGARTLTVLKTPIPYVQWVTNPAPAFGGTDSEDLEHAKWRGPQVLRSRERAVTPEDFEFLARAATPAISRARCAPIQTAPHANAAATDDQAPAASPGYVRLLLVPALPETNLLPTRADLQVPHHVQQDVRVYLDDRRLLTCEVILDEARVTWVVVLARLRCRPESDRERVQQEATAAVQRFIHPTLGGPDGSGWPFGRELFAGDIYTLLQQVPDVVYVEEVILQSANPDTREFGEPAMRVSPGLDGLLASFEHRVDVRPVEFGASSFGAFALNGSARSNGGTNGTSPKNGVYANGVHTPVSAGAAVPS